MKSEKIYIWLSIITALLLTGGCQKSIVIDEWDKEKTLLSFNATLGAAQTASRAAESDNKMLENASATGVKPPHIIIHTYTGTPGSSLKYYFDDELGYFSTGNYWDVNSGKQRFLPQGGMNLYGYFATDFAGKGELLGVDYSPPATSIDYPKLQYTVANDDALHQLDLIAAKVENISNPDILVPFQHILSQVNFGVKGIDRHRIMVKNIRITNISSKGTFDYRSWAWSANTPTSFPYFFPDRTTKEPNNGTGDSYQTQGTDKDSQNTYIFGDGGKFGPGSGNTLFYAQTEPIQSNYKTVAGGSERLENSLMLIPQEITKNSNAKVVFDYKITINGRTIREGTDVEASLDAYYDWKPNLRYVYLFDFEDPSKEIVFDVLINEWENWDSNGQNTGIKNGTIQQPVASTLNNETYDDETIFLIGLLDRSELWDWSDGSKYTFANLNTLTLDFSGVEMRGYTVEVKVPVGFNISGTNPSQGGKIKITRQSEILLEPTAIQLNTIKNGQAFPLYGTLASSLSWDWNEVNFTSLYLNQSFELDFTSVTFESGKTISITLPDGVVAAGTGISGSNPYIISQNTKVTITNRREKDVIEPSRVILNLVANGSEIGVNGGSISSSNPDWNWSNTTYYPFSNLDPQESFDIIFSGISFNGKQIQITLPPGFRASGVDGTKLNLYLVSVDGKVTIKNNNINYPDDEFISNISGGSTITLAGEFQQNPKVLGWSSIPFSSFSPQTTFTFDVTGVDFYLKQLQLILPPFLSLAGGAGVSIAGNTYTFTQPTSVTIKNTKVPLPADQTINLMIPGGSTTVKEGKFLQNEYLDWKGLQMTSLARSNTFTVDFTDVDFNGKYVEINAPGLTITGIGVTNPSFGVYRITQNTTVTVTEQRWSISGGNPTFTGQVSAGQRVVLKGTVAFGGQAWAWNQMPNLNRGESFEIDYSQLNLEGSSPLSIPIAGQTYSLSGDFGKSWGYLFWNGTKGTNGVVRFTRLWDVSGANPSLTSVTAGTRVTLGGTVTGNQAWSWDQLPNLATGQWFEIDYSLLDLNGTNLLSLPFEGQTYSLSGDFGNTWAYLMWNGTKGTNGIVRLTKIVQYAFPVINNGPPAITNGTYTLPAGTVYGLYWWGWGGKGLTKGGSSFYTISFANITFEGTIKVILPTGYSATATGQGFAINGTELTITGKCVVTVRYY